MPVKVTQKCVGCSACQNICPVNAIKMVQDKSGFYIPLIDNTKCIECGKCENVCQQEKIIEKNEPIRCIVLMHKNEEIWRNSTSGGAFTAICELFDRNTYYCGVIVDNLIAKHHIVKGEGAGFSCFQKSKYVQSWVGDIYKKIQSLLTKGERVIFSGTPCQVAALKLYLNKEYDNLICIDVVCHGVGSPSVLSDHINHLEEHHKYSIKDYSFRTKTIKCGRLLDYGITYTINSEKISDYNDAYVEAFHNGSIIGTNCTHCQFHNKKRVGDITIGDLKGMYENFPEFGKNPKNRSSVFANTGKGVWVLSKLEEREDLEINESSFEKVSYRNSPLHSQHDLAISEKRNTFYSSYSIGTKQIENQLKKCGNKKSLVLKCWLLIPEYYRVVIKNIIRR